jgi:hypothetical protein
MLHARKRRERKTVLLDTHTVAKRALSLLRVMVAASVEVKVNTT